MISVGFLLLHCVLDKGIEWRAPGNIIVIEWTD